MKVAIWLFGNHIQTDKVKTNSLVSNPQRKRLGLVEIGEKGEHFAVGRWCPLVAMMDRWNLFLLQRRPVDVLVRLQTVVGRYLLVVTN